MQVRVIFFFPRMFEFKVMAFIGEEERIYLEH